MRAPRTLGAWGVTLVLGMFSASALMPQCAPPPPPPAAAVPTDHCVNLVNQERAKRGIGPVSVDGRLTTAAQNHSNYQASILKMSHTGSGGTNPGQRMTNAGYAWRTWAENVAAGQADCTQVMSAWMNSSGHRANILNTSMVHIGMGVARGSNGVLYWTMDLAAPR